MLVELLAGPECPHANEALAELKRKAGVLLPEAEVVERQVADAEQAAELGMAGSPSLRIDGRMFDPVGPGGGRLACRSWPESEGVPPDWWLEAALLWARRPQHLLFLCRANSARSQLAEAIARSLAPGGMRVCSAGSEPTELRPEVGEVLAEIGLDSASQRAKPIDDVELDAIDAVITLCSEEICPFFPRPVAQLHWPLADPVAAGGLDAFRRCRDELRQRLAVLLQG